MEKIVSQLDAKGFFIGAVTAYPSPLESGVFHIPGGAVDALPPEPAEPGKRYAWRQDRWEEQALPEFPEPEFPTEEQRRAATIAYRDALLAQATLRIDPLNDAIALDIATDEERTALAAWRLYRVAVARADVERDPVQWPLPPALP